MFPAELLEAAPPARPSFLLQLIKYIENHHDEKFAATENPTSDFLQLRESKQRCFVFYFGFN